METAGSRYFAGVEGVTTIDPQDKRNCLLQNIAENSSVSMKVRYVLLNKNKRSNSNKFQQEQQHLQLERKHLQQMRLQRLQEQEQQLQFQEQRLQNEQLLEVPELEEEARRRFAEDKLAEILLAVVLSTKENNLKDTLSQLLNLAQRVAELSPKVC